MLGDLKMARLSSTLTFAIFLLRQTSSLQVSPNSPCASVCIDDPTQDVSDPNTSNTHGSDIVCSDAHYETAVGQKFERCVSCLQNSSFSNAGENDQSWFLYNVRYAIDSCLFGFANATDPITTPCSTDNACGPLQDALEDGNLIPSNETMYSYCNADNNALLGSFGPKCLSCLQTAGDEHYIANFLIALQAGCEEQPPAGTVIGIQGTVFSTVPVNITYPGYREATNNAHHGLTQGAIIGIAVSMAVLVILVASVLFVCLQKHRYLLRMKKLNSPLDSRFGAKNITSPQSGAYGNPYNSPPIASHTFNPHTLSVKERAVLGLQTSQNPSESHAKEWQQDSKYSTPNSSLPPYSGGGIPAHQAYNPAISPGSPVTSIASSTNDNHDDHEDENSYKMSSYSKPRSPPNQISSSRPPPINIKLSLAKQQISAPIHQKATENLSPPYPTSDGTHPSPNPPPSINSVGFSPDIPPSVFSDRPSPNPPPPQPPRSIPRAESTRGKGSTIRLGLANAISSRDKTLDISGPVVSHGKRFDFELAERKRQEQELEAQRAAAFSRRGRLGEENPKSAMSEEEQWPGSY